MKRFSFRLLTVIIPVMLLMAFSCTKSGNTSSDNTPSDNTPKEVRDVLLYISTDGRVVTPNNPAVFGAEIISNVYEEGIGTLSFSDVVSVIGDGAFKGCTTLAGIDLGKTGILTKASEGSAGITSIGARAFEACSGLKELTVPATVSQIGDDAFKGCTALRSLSMLSAVPPTTGNNVLEGTDCPVIVPAGAETAYKNATGWSSYVEQINGALPETDGIDLGLPSGLKWASCNLGASAPQNAGYYYAWGETATKEAGYNWLNYAFGDNLSVSKYTKEDGHIILLARDDVATVHLGDKWRMPTSAEIQELIDGCNWSSTMLEGKAGYQGTSKVNGQTVFFPATGSVSGGMEYGIEYEGSYDGYWSSELRYAANSVLNAYTLLFAEGNPGVSDSFRSLGYQVRPVRGDIHAVESITVNHQKLTLSKGEGYEINATVSPSYASLQSVEWSSGNAAVVVSPRRGGVFGLTTGSADIIARSVDGGLTARCQITVTEPSYTVPEAVDLGLPSGLKWASCNLGAASPIGFGVCFAWGETAPNGAYSSAGYSLCTGSLSVLNKYVLSSNHGSVDNLRVLEESDDAASVLLKDGWRIPSEADFKELLDGCEYAFTSEEGIPGYKMISKTNGKSLFFPASGYAYDNGRNGLDISSIGKIASYWTATLSDNDYLPVCFIGFGTGAPYVRAQLERVAGLPIRPVRP